MRKKIIILVLQAMICSIAVAQTVLTGTVKDKTTLEPLIGANIFVMNENNRSLQGAAVDINGEYHIAIPNNQNKLTIVFSFVGYKTLKVKYTGQPTINALMEDESNSIQGVEVVAKHLDKDQFGISRREMVSATQKVNLDVATAPVTSLADALQGAMANVDILTQADPGTKSQIRIRGINTLNGSADPLFVVDGVPLPVTVPSDVNLATANTDDYSQILNISPNDIESIEVLKDAAATAIWGSKGANGVLLIKTKTGHKGKIQFSFSTKYEIRKEGNSIPVLNSSQYVSLLQDELWNSINDLGYNTSPANTYIDLLSNNQQINFDPTYKYFNEFNVDTDWQKEVTKTAHSSDNNFSLSGGGEKADYLLSLGYLNETGTAIGTKYNRFNLMYNMDYRFSNKLDVSARFNFTSGSRDASYTDGQLDTSPRGQAFIKMPNMSPYYIDSNGKRTNQYFTPYIENDLQGTYASTSNYNPVALVHEATNNTKSTNGRMIFVLHYKFLKNFDYYGTVGLNITANRMKKYLPNSVTGVEWTSKYFNLSTDATSDVFYLTTENRFLYNKQFNANNKLIIAGRFTTEDEINSSYTSTTSGNSSGSITDPTSGNTINSLSNGRSETRNMSGNMQFHYDFFNRYMFDAGYNVEANSSMAAKGRWGGFPTVGVAWIFGDEKALSKQKIMSNGKIRLSWGETGNAPSGAYPYIGVFKPQTTNYGDMKAVYPSSIELDNLKWEITSKTNIGLDMGFMKDRLLLSLDLYKNRTRNLLQKNVSIPSSTGYSSVAWYNSGKMENTGWELSGSYDAFRNKNWTVSLNFNISQNKNKVIDIPSNLYSGDGSDTSDGNTSASYTFGNSNYACKVVPGDPLGSFYGYKCLGVYQNVQETYAKDNGGNLIHDVDGSPVVMQNGTQKVYPGDAKYKDQNGDGVIDKYDIVYLGNSNPTVTGGFGFVVRYKQVSLIANFFGRGGQKVINSARMNLENMYGANNQSRATLTRWRREGDNTMIPRALYGRGYNYLGSDRFVEDASFLKLKTLTVKWALPMKLINRWGLNRMDFYCTAYNLYTWTKYKGQDPEISLSTTSGIFQLAKDGATTPKPLQIAFGLNLGF